MAASFLPPDTAQLTEPTSIALIQALQRQAIATPLCPDPIATSFIRQGQGEPPILLLHGFDSSVLEFRRLFPLLATGRETWAIDLLGFGFTDRPTAVSFNPEAIKTHLYYTWKTLIARPMVLVGASMGGAAAIDFAFTYPEAVDRLVLIDSAGFAKGPAAMALLTADSAVGRFARACFQPFGYLAANFLRSAAVRRRVSLQAYVDPRFVSADALLCAALHLGQPNWHQALIAFTRSGGYTFLADKIARIASPTLILWGDGDRILGTQDADRFAAAIANSRLVWIPNSGHVPHLEQPQVTAAQILAFCDEQPYDPNQ